MAANIIKEEAKNYYFDTELDRIVLENLVKIRFFDPFSDYENKTLIEEIAKTHPKPKVRELIIEYEFIKDEASLYTIATSDREDNVRAAAIEKMKDSELIGKTAVINLDAYDFACYCAVKLTESRTHLKRVYDYLKDWESPFIGGPKNRIMGKINRTVIDKLFPDDSNVEVELSI